jgi:hypothetical protein
MPVAERAEHAALAFAEIDAEARGRARDAKAPMAPANEAPWGPFMIQNLSPAWKRETGKKEGKILYTQPEP